MSVWRFAHWLVGGFRLGLSPVLAEHACPSTGGGQLPSPRSMRLMVVGLVAMGLMCRGARGRGARVPWGSWPWGSCAVGLVAVGLVAASMRSIVSLSSSECEVRKNRRARLASGWGAAVSPEAPEARSAPAAPPGAVPTRAEGGRCWTTSPGERRPPPTSAAWTSVCPHRPGPADTHCGVVSPVRARWLSSGQGSPDASHQGALSSPWRNWSFVSFTRPRVANAPCQLPSVVVKAA